MADVFTQELSFGVNKVGIMAPDVPGAPYRTIQISNLGPELNLDPTFATPAYWSAGVGWTVTGNALQAVAATDDYCYHIGGGIQLGHTYQYILTVAGYSAGQVQAFCGGTVFGTQLAANGTVQGTFVAPTDNDFGVHTTGAFTGNVTGLSIREVL